MPFLQGFYRFLKGFCLQKSFSTPMELLKIWSSTPMELQEAGRVAAQSKGTRRENIFFTYFYSFLKGFYR